MFIKFTNALQEANQNPGSVIIIELLEKLIKSGLTAASGGKPLTDLTWLHGLNFTNEISAVSHIPVIPPRLISSSFAEKICGTCKHNQDAFMGNRIMH